MIALIGELDPHFDELVSRGLVEIHLHVNEMCENFIQLLDVGATHRRRLGRRSHVIIGFAPNAYQILHILRGGKVRIKTNVS